MKNTSTLFIAVIALLCSSTIVAGSVVNCSDLTVQADCNNNTSTCNWNVIQNEGMCEQTIDCTTQEYNTCLDENHKAYCSQTGNYACSQNLNTCRVSGTGECNTAAGCTENVQTCVAVGEWKCNTYSYTSQKQCSEFFPYCSNGPVQCVSNGQGTCKATVTSPAQCTGPCVLGTFNCVNACSMTNPTQQTCEAQAGCVFTGGDTPICGPKVSCSSRTTADDCGSAGSGCSVSYPCALTTDSQTKYCADNLNVCTTDKTVSGFCTESFPCQDDDTYCDKSNPQICGPTNVATQCKSTTSCDNDAKCTTFNTKDDCPQNSLCLWTDTTKCSNITPSDTCTGQSNSQTGCENLASTGCQYTQGGSCNTKVTDNTAAGILCAVSAFVAYLFML